MVTAKDKLLKAAGIPIAPTIAEQFPRGDVGEPATAATAAAPDRGGGVPTAGAIAPEFGRKEGQAVILRGEGGVPTGLISPAGVPMLGLSRKEIRDQLAAISGKAGALPILDTGVLMTERRDEEARLKQEELRRLGFQTETGSAELSAGLQEDILNMPSMAPEPLYDSTTDTLNWAAEKMGLYKVGGVPLGQPPENATALELAIYDLRQIVTLTGLSITGGAGLALLSVLTIGASALPGGGLISAGLAYFGGSELVDWKGGKMNTLRQGITKTVEDGERIEASVRNGMDPALGIKQIENIIGELDNAEIEIQNLGNHNLDYRYSAEYIQDMKNIRSARSVANRRILAIENMAVSGTAAINPDALLFHLSQFEGLESLQQFG